MFTSFNFTFACEQLIFLFTNNEGVHARTNIEKRSRKMPLPGLSRLGPSATRVVIGMSRVICLIDQEERLLVVRLQSSPYFCVFNYPRTVKHRSENRVRDWFFVFFPSPLTPRKKNVQSCSLTRSLISRPNHVLTVKKCKNP